MTAVVESNRYVGFVGDLKVIVIKTDATAATGHTIDLGSDTFADQGIKTVLLTLVQDDAGADKTSTWDPETGIITLGSITTGIHSIMIVGV